MSLLPPGGPTSARKQSRGEGRRCYAASRRFQERSSLHLTAGETEAQAESDLQERQPGPRSSGLPPQCSAPAGGVGWVRASRGVPPRLTKAQTHLGSRAGSPRPAQWGSRGSRRSEDHGSILVGGRRAPRSRAAPTSRPEAGLAGTRPASLPVTPPGGLAPGGPWRLVCIPGWSDRLGSPSWPARLSHSAGPTLLCLPRILAGTSHPLNTHS